MVKALMLAVILVEVGAIIFALAKERGEDI
jgi:hypothetical protein